MRHAAHACALAGLGVLMACGGSTSGGSTTGSGGDGAGDQTGSGGSGGGGGGGATACFSEHNYPIPAEYEQFGPTFGSHCLGTNHQDITGVERLVFLGDSITQGTFPTGTADFYRTVLADRLTQKFPGLVVDECAVNGARVGDLLMGDMQIAECFPGPEPRKTLVVMTMGGNDYRRWPEDMLSQAEAEADAVAIAATFREAIEWFYADPARFPNGVYVIFANNYEYTDGTADLDSCPAASLIGLGGEYIQGATALSKLNELYMEIAVDTGSDMVFMLEEFCGHGYRRDEPGSPCYRGPNAELWFDVSCIHPTPPGHHHLAEMFGAVVDE